MFRRHDRAARSETAGGETAQTSRVEMPRRVLDVPVAPSAHHAGAAATTGRVAVGDAGPVLVHGLHAPQPSATSERHLVVGGGIELKGDVKGCHKLVVDGDLEGGITASEHLVVGEEGGLRGSCEVETAEIAGSFDGTLTVRGRLSIRATGRVKGDIRFGELEIERGGQLAGNVDAHARGPHLAPVAAAGGD